MRCSVTGLLASAMNSPSSPHGGFELLQDPCFKLERRGSYQLVVLVLWSTKNTLLVSVNLISQPFGRGGNGFTAVRDGGVVRESIPASDICDLGIGKMEASCVNGKAAVVLPLSLLR